MGLGEGKLYGRKEWKGEGSDSETTWKRFLQLVLFDLKNPTWKQYLPQKTLYLQAPLLGWASLDAPTPNKLLVGIVELSLEK